MSEETRCYLIQVDTGGLFLFVRELQVVGSYVVQCKFRWIVLEPKPVPIDELTGTFPTGSHWSLILAIPTGVE